jgi:hypothetical protein
MGIEKVEPQLDGQTGGRCRLMPTFPAPHLKVVCWSIVDSVKGCASPPHQILSCGMRYACYQSEFITLLASGGISGDTEKAKAHELECALCWPRFPATILATLPSTVSVDANDLYWSAVTVGRPNVLSPRPWKLLPRRVHLALRYHRRQHRENERGNGLYNSAAFNALDMTEKGWVNFSLGMLFTKLFADKLLDMPWLFHFKWFQVTIPLERCQANQLRILFGLIRPDLTIMRLKPRGEVGASRQRR